MELHQLDAARVVGTGEETRELLGEIGLARTGRAVEHDLLTLLKRVDDLLQLLARHVQAVGELVGDLGQRGHRARGGGLRDLRLGGVAPRVHGRQQRVEPVGEVDDRAGLADQLGQGARQGLEIQGDGAPQHGPLELLPAVLHVPEVVGEGAQVQLGVGDGGHHVLWAHPGQERVQLRGELEARLVVQVRVALLDGLGDLEPAGVGGDPRQVRGGQRDAVLRDPLPGLADSAPAGPHEPRAAGVVIAVPLPLVGHGAAVPVHGLTELRGQHLRDPVQVLVDVELVDPGRPADEVGERVADPRLVLVLDDRLEVAGPHQVLEAVADGPPVAGRRARGPLELPRVGQGRVADGGVELGPVDDERAQPAQVLPHLHVEAQAAGQRALLGEDLVEVGGDLRRLVHPGQHVADAASLEARGDGAQRQLLDVQQLGGQQHHRPRGALELVVQRLHDRGAGRPGRRRPGRARPAAGAGRVVRGVGVQAAGELLRDLGGPGVEIVLEG